MCQIPFKILSIYYLLSSQKYYEVNINIFLHLIDVEMQKQRGHVGCFMSW